MRLRRTGHIRQRFRIGQQHHVSGITAGTSSPASQPDTQTLLKITVNGEELLAEFEDNSSAEEFKELLGEGPLTLEMSDYGGFEKVGALGRTLSRNDEQITAVPGDVILYQGDQITLYYGTNTWSFTRIARLQDPSGLEKALGSGTVEATFSLA